MIEDGPRIYFIDRGTGPHLIGLFVVGLIAFITGANALVMLAVNIVVAAVMLVVAIVSGGVFMAVWKARRKRMTMPWNQAGLLAYVDRQTGLAHDASGRPLAQLAQVSFAPEFQLTSSSKSLALRHPGGTIVIARGSPFGGSIHDFTDQLRARGFAA